MVAGERDQRLRPRPLLRADAGRPPGRAPRRRVPGERLVLCEPGARLPPALRRGIGLLPRTHPRRRVHRSRRRVRPAAVGRRLHRDERLGDERLGAARSGRPRRAARWPRGARHAPRRPVLRARDRDHRGEGRLRPGHPRDGRGAHRADGHVRHLEPARPPHPVHLPRGRASRSHAGDHPGGPRPAVHRLRPRSGLPGRRGQRRAERVVAVRGARPVSARAGLRRIRRDDAAVPPRDAPAGDGHGGRDRRPRCRGRASPHPLAHDRRTGVDEHLRPTTRCWPVARRSSSSCPPSRPRGARRPRTRRRLSAGCWCPTRPRARARLCSSTTRPSRA